MTKRSRRIYLAAGPLLFLACLFLLPHALFQTMEARAAVGTVAWMAFWWVTSPVDYAVTAFLPIALNANFSDDRYEVGDFQLCIGDDFVVAWCVYFDSLLGKDGTGPQDCDLLFESDRKQATQSGGVLVFTDCDFVDSSAKCSGMRDDHTDCSIDAQLCW